MAEQHNLALLTGFELAKAFDFSRYKKILDLGGGTGAASIALCKSYPTLETIVFDLPENIETAKKIIEKEELSARISLMGGDFKQGDLPNDLMPFCWRILWLSPMPKKTSDYSKIYMKNCRRGEFVF